MDNYFETILLEAIERCKDFYIDKQRNGFSKIYPFITENTNGYIKHFDLENKSLLTVGSSSDQAINARLHNTKDITIIDICPFTKFYFYLKVAAILTLNYNEFLEFFCYKDFPKFCNDNKNAFNKNKFNTLKPILRNLDYESYLFWDELFTLYPNETIRRKLFSHDEYRLNILKKINLYLKDEETYNKTKKEILKSLPTFIIGDIKRINLTKNYDNIWLSNIGKYLKLEEFKPLIDKMYKHLNPDGKLLICYLYEIYINTKYQENWEEIYNLDKVFKTFQNYNIEAINITGIRDILFERNNSNDMILLCKKLKR